MSGKKPIRQGSGPRKRKRRSKKITFFKAVKITLLTILLAAIVAAVAGAISVAFIINNADEIDPNSIIVKHEFRLRTKILKPEGARHANIDITYYDTDFGKSDYNDELNDLKIRVFTKNEKGKVVKRSVDTKGFARERINENYVVLHVEVPDVQAGSIIEYQYDISSTRPGFLYDWVFQDSIPTVFTKCDIDIPAILQFNMNVPIHRLIRSGVEVGRLNYDTNRPDMKKGKSCPTNHYTVIGEYIVPEGHPLKNNTTADKIAPFTSQIITPGITPPPALPAGSTHLKIQ